MHAGKEKMAVFGILVRDGNVLVVRRTKQEIGKNKMMLTWGFPGGKLELGENMEDGVVREVYEESGYAVRVEKLVSERVHPNFPVRAFYFSCHIITDVADEVNDEGTREVRWIKISDVALYFSSKLDPIVQDFLLQMESYEGSPPC